MKPRFLPDEEKYATHIPMLTRCVSLTTKDQPILELGVGYSTFILDMMCQLTGQQIFSYENDREWHGKNLDFHTSNHKVIFTDNWDRIDIDSIHWGVALIDHRPALRRRIDAMRLRNNADYIILHDTEPEIERFYRYQSIYKHFKYVFHYTRCKPYTTVLSNFKELKNL